MMDAVFVRYKRDAFGRSGLDSTRLLILDHVKGCKLHCSKWTGGPPDQRATDQGNHGTPGLRDQSHPETEPHLGKKNLDPAERTGKNIKNIYACARGGGWGPLESLTRREVAAGTQCSARTTLRSSGSKATYDVNFQCAFRLFFDQVSTLMSVTDQSQRQRQA